MSAFLYPIGSFIALTNEWSTPDLLNIQQSCRFWQKLTNFLKKLEIALRFSQVSSSLEVIGCLDCIKRPDWLMLP
jgi:hypothetical protein